MHSYLQHLTTHVWFQRIVISAILLNSIVLGMETYAAVNEMYGPVLRRVDIMFMSFFVIEIVLRIGAERWSFFRGGWNWFDFLIVVVSLLPFLGNLSALRALRILRALRLLTVIPMFRRILLGISTAIRNSIPVAVVLGVIMYIYGVMSSKLFGHIDPVHFGDLDNALLTLFQIMTLDSWNAIVRPIISEVWFASLFFISFVLIAVFILLSIVIGIASDAMGSTSDRVSNEDLLAELKRSQR